MPIKAPPPVQSPGLQPVARPVRVFGAPEAPNLAANAPVSEFSRLAEHLAHLNPSLARFGTTYLRRKDLEGEAAANTKALVTPAQQLNTEIKSGAVSPQTNLAVLATKNGEHLARDHFEDIRQRYLGQNTSKDPTINNAFDRDNGDLRTWFAKAASEKLQQVSPDPYSRGSYAKNMMAYEGQLYQEHDGYYQQRVKAKNLDSAFQDLYGVTTKAIEGGEFDPAKIHEAMRSAAGNTAALHRLTPQKMNEATIRVAQAYATQGVKGRPELAPKIVQELLLSDRGGIGSIGMTAQYADTAAKLIDKATATANEQQGTLSRDYRVAVQAEAARGEMDVKAFDRFNESNPHVFPEAERESLILKNTNALERARVANQQTSERLISEARSQESEAGISQQLRELGFKGNLHAIPEQVTYLKKDGETGTYNRNDLEQRAVREYLAESSLAADQYRQEQQRRQSGYMDSAPPGPTPEQVKLENDIAWFSHNPTMQHPAWKELLNGGFAGFSPAALANNQPPPALLQATKLYEELEAKAPGVLDKHISSTSAKDFYSLYRVAKTYLGQDDRQALTLAGIATKGTPDLKAEAPTKALIEKELGEANSFFSWAPNVKSWGDAHDDVKRVSMLMTRMGLPVKDAVDKAGEQVRKSYENINGFLVRTNDRSVQEFGMHLRSLGLQPKGFADTVKDYLTDYAKGAPLGSGSTTWDDGSGTVHSLQGKALSIRRVSDGGGGWVVIDPANGFPVPTEGRSAIFSARDLVDFEQQRQLQKQGQTAADIAAAQTRRQQVNTLPPTAVQPVPGKRARPVLNPNNEQAQPIAPPAQVAPPPAATQPPPAAPPALTTPPPPPAAAPPAAATAPPAAAQPRVPIIDLRPQLPQPADPQQPTVRAAKRTPEDLAAAERRFKEQQAAAKRAREGK